MSLTRLIGAGLVWLTLGVLMSFWVFTQNPEPEVIVFCFVAWCGGIAFAAVVWLADRARRDRRERAANGGTPRPDPAAEEGPELR